MRVTGFRVCACAPGDDGSVATLGVGSVFGFGSAMLRLDRQETVQTLEECRILMIWESDFSRRISRVHRLSMLSTHAQTETLRLAQMTRFRVATAHASCVRPESIASGARGRARSRLLRRHQHPGVLTGAVEIPRTPSPPVSARGLLFSEDVTPRPPSPLPRPWSRSMFAPIALFGSDNNDHRHSPLGPPDEPQRHPRITLPPLLRAAELARCGHSVALPVVAPNCLVTLHPLVAMTRNTALSPRTCSYLQAASAGPITPDPLL
jgi:hypothetical protein